MKIKIHPLFFLLALTLIALGQAFVFVATFAAAFLHEMAHAVIAKSRGYCLNEMVLLPYGAVLSGEESIEKVSSIIIALAGPILNFVLSLFTLGLWWLFPATYPYTEMFLKANLVIGIFNLLPAFPLDGARVVLGLAKKKNKALKGLKIAGVVLSVVLFALFIASALFKINFTLGIMAVFLFLGATFGTDKEMYFHVTQTNFKNYNEGVSVRKVLLSCEVPLLRAVKHLKSEYLTTFEVVDKKGNEMFTIDEPEMKKLFEKNPLNKSIKEAVLTLNKLAEK